MKFNLIKKVAPVAVAPAPAPAPRLSLIGQLTTSANTRKDAKRDFSPVDYDTAEDVKVTRSKIDERAIIAQKKGEYIIVVCDTPSHEVYAKGLGMGKKSKKMFLQTANDKNVPTDLFRFISPCPPMPDDVLGTTKAREGKWLEDHRHSFLMAYEKMVHDHGAPSAIITLGLHATQQVMGKKIKITRVRGQIRHLDEFNVPILPMISPGQVFRQPGMAEQFMVDFDMLARMRDYDYQVNAAELAIKDVSYRYISGRELLRLLEEQQPAAIAWDTETYNNGGSNSWWAGSKPFIFQVSWEKGVSYIVPIQSFQKFENRPLADRKGKYDYWTIDQREAKDNLLCVKSVLESPNYYFTGHNLAYDWHVMENVGVRPNLRNWLHDSMQLCFVRNENTFSKDLSTATKLYCPDLSGYADAFESSTDYSEMPRVDPDKMLFYAAADSDASLRITNTLVELTSQDERHYNCYTRIQMPALRMFYGMERLGMIVDPCRVREFVETTEEVAQELYDGLIEQVHPDIRKKFFDPKKPKNGLSFKRTTFLLDILFYHPQGLRLTPSVYTKGTKKLPDDQKVPSTSAKDHLPYFEDNVWVAEYLQYNKYQTILTFAGEEGEISDDGTAGDAKGIWKYINPNDGAIHPSYFLHRTVTGRVASANPNGQNIPKHGKLAKAYRNIFVARPGKTFVSVDLSQAELRVAAWESMDKVMLKLYNEGKDLHAATAARTMGLMMEEFYELAEKVRDEKRQAAKAVNFGFLFGMWWKKFKAYAKTTYGVEVTDEDARMMREAFFDLYKGLEAWHKSKRKFVNETGYVRGLHGRIRHLPEIRSYDKGIQQMAERQAINSTVQGFSSDWCLMGAIRFDRDAPRNEARVLAPIHDAIILEVDIDKAELYGSYMKFYLENQPLKKWFNIEAPLPMVADVEIGDNLKELRKMPCLQAIKPPFFTED